MCIYDTHQRQLNEKDNYHILPQDPTLGSNNLVNQAIDRFKKEKLITDKIADGLKTPDPRTPRFYITTKIHKSGKPGPPIVRSVNCTQLTYVNTLTTIYNPL